MNHKFPLLSDVFPDYDPQAQLEEIRLLLDHVFTWRNELRGEIAQEKRELEQTKPGTVDHAIAHNSYNTLGWHSFYRDAACSQAAVGALAPFVEGMLVHMFAYLRTPLGSTTKRNEHRRRALSVDAFWDPHNVSKEGRRDGIPKIVLGTMEIIESLGIQSDFPDSLETVLRALFSYRNSALHNGYEWPAKECNKFKGLIDTAKWDQWFAWATSGGRPWIVFAQDVFIKTCLEMAGQVLGAFNKVAKRWGGNCF